MCALSETKIIVTYSAYADNYASSFQEAKTYQDVKKYILAVHEKIGLPLINVWTGVNTDKDIIHILTYLYTYIFTYSYTHILTYRKENEGGRAIGRAGRRGRC